MPFAFLCNPLYIDFVVNTFVVDDAAKGGGPKSSDDSSAQVPACFSTVLMTRHGYEQTSCWYCLFFQSFIVSQRDLMFKCRSIWFNIFQPIESIQSIDDLDLLQASCCIASVPFVRVIIAIKQV